MGWQKEWAGPGSGPIVRPADSQASLRLGWGGGRVHGVGVSSRGVLGYHVAFVWTSCEQLYDNQRHMVGSVGLQTPLLCSGSVSPPPTPIPAHTHTHRNRHPLRRTAPVDAREHTLTVSITVFLAWWFEESQLLIEISTKREKSNTNYLFGTSLPKGMISRLWQTLTSMLMVIYNHRGVISKSMDVITST